MAEEEGWKEPIYYGTESEALKHGYFSGEYSEFEENKVVTEEFIHDLTYGMLYEDFAPFDPGDMLDRFQKKYGSERVNYMFAAIVKAYGKDGGKDDSYPVEVRSWARTIRTSGDPDVMADVRLERKDERIEEMIGEIIERERNKKPPADFDISNLSKEKRVEFAFNVEHSKNFEAYNFRNYADARGGGLPYAQRLMWGVRHKSGNEEQQKWIEDLFEDMNYHRENWLLGNEDYNGFFQEVMNDNLRVRPDEVVFDLPYEACVSKYSTSAVFKMPETSEYKGYHFSLSRDDGEVEFPKGASMARYAKIRLPIDAEIKLLHHTEGTLKNIPAELLCKELKDKTANEFIEQKTQKKNDDVRGK